MKKIVFSVIISLLLSGFVCIKAAEADERNDNFQYQTEKSILAITEIEVTDDNGEKPSCSDITIVFDANGGENAPSSITASITETICIPTLKPNRNGYIFIGWAESPEATEAIYEIGDKKNFLNNTTLYAVWLQCSFQDSSTESCIVINSTAKSPALKLYVVVYNGNLLVDAIIKDVILDVGENKIETELSWNKLEYNRLKFFLWDKNLMPYTEVKNIELDTYFLPIDLNDAIYQGTQYIKATGELTASNSWTSWHFDASKLQLIKRYTAASNSNTYYAIGFYNSKTPSADSFMADESILFSTGGKLCEFTDIEIPSDCVTVVLAHRSATLSVSNVATELYGVLTETETDIIEDAIDANGEVTKTIYHNIPNLNASNNDIVFIQDELWLNQHNSATGVTTHYRYKFVNGELILSSTLNSDFGHCNIIDYCEENDCLIFGNGANDTKTDGNYFCVVKNPLALSGTVSIDNVGIKYPVDIGYKVQALWGDNNFGECNIVYLLSNSKELRKIMLLKDDNGEFNGKFIQIGDVHTFTIATTGFQGGTYFSGYLYLSFGGAKYQYVRVSENNYAEEYFRKHYYNNDGTERTGVIQGIHIDADYMWLYCNISNSTSSYKTVLTRYER